MPSGRDAQRLLLFQRSNLDRSSMLMGRCDWLLSVATIVILNSKDLRAPAETNTLVRISLIVAAAQLTPKARLKPPEPSLH